MRIIKTGKLGEKKGIRLGYGPKNRSLMSVLHVVGYLIDPGQHHIHKYIIEQPIDKKHNRMNIGHHYKDHSGNAAAIKISMNSGIGQMPISWVTNCSFWKTLRPDSLDFTEGLSEKAIDSAT